MDLFQSFSNGLGSPAFNAFNAYSERSDTVDLAVATRAVYTGSGGDIKVTMVGGGEVVFEDVPPGTKLDIRIARLWSTGTTATDVIGLI